MNLTFRYYFFKIQILFQYISAGNLPAVGGTPGCLSNMFYVYVIKSLKDNRNYIGITNNLERRIKEHNRGKSSTPSTKFRGPFKLIYFEKVTNRKIAREREKFLKSGRGREFLKSKNSSNIIPV